MSPNGKNKNNNLNYSSQTRKRRVANKKPNYTNSRPRSPFIEPVAFPEFEADDSYEEMPIEEVFQSGDIFDADDKYSLARCIVSSEPSVGVRVQRLYRF